MPGRDIQLCATALTVVDDTLFALGACLSAGVLLLWAVRRRRDPLLDIPDRPNRLIPEAVLLPMLAWMFSGGALTLAAERWVSGDTQAAAGIWAGNVAQLLGGGACLWMAAKFFDRGVKGFLFGQAPVGHQAAVGAAYFLASLAICHGVLYATVELLSRIDPNYNFFPHEVIEALRGHKAPVFTLWIGTVVIAPIAEECFFRGILQNTLENVLHSRWIAVTLTAAIFGAIHVGGADAPQPHVVPALTVLGVLLGVAYLRTGSLLAPITLHALFNAKTLLWESLSHTGG